jgi:PAS domain S-box-containing protein
MGLFFFLFEEPIMDDKPTHKKLEKKVKDLGKKPVEHKYPEEALRGTEEEYNAFIENTLMGIFIHQDGRYVYVNKRFSKIHGYAPEELIGKRHLLLTHPNQRKTIKKRTDKRLKGEYVPIRYEVRRIRKDRKIIWCEVMTARIQYKGRPAIMGNIIDISQRKQVEEELKISGQQLRDLSAYLQSSREQERTSIAREVHDDLGQALTALKMDLFWLEKRLPKDQEPLIEKTKSMEKLLDTAIESVERIITQLRPGILDDLGLAEAIEWQTIDFQSRTGVKCKLNLDLVDTVFEKEHSTAIFRIVQEALTNVWRHANATMVSISLKKKSGELRLEVKDNGKGIPKKKISHPKSFGLIGIRERAHVLGGKSNIKAVRNKGTTVTVTIPVEKNI